MSLLPNHVIGSCVEFVALAEGGSASRYRIGVQMNYKF
jgi:hypothetical protein